MNKHQQTVMSMLKPKVKAFGFNQKELKGIAAKIADNLTSEEDASEEDVNAEIEKAIDAVLPYLEFGQSFANRVINDSKNVSKTNEDDDDDEPKSSSTNQPKPKKKESSDETPEWAKVLIASNENLKNELAALKGEKVTDSRRSKLEKLLKDTGTFGTRMLKTFSKIKFENDEEFDDFYSEVEEDLKSFNQERANAGLAKLGSPAVGGGQGKKEEKEILSDDDIKAIANVRS